MNDLTIIKQNGGAYIDSRQVAKFIGKRHHDLLRDIGRYRKYTDKSIESKIAFNDFFVGSSYIDSIGRTRPRYLVSKRGAEVIANKLTGEKGVIFTFAYVTKFNAMEAAERAELEKHSATPQLRVFNTAVRNVLSGLSQSYSTPEEIVNFLRGAYKPFGINVAPIGGNRGTLTATDIARMLAVYSENGLPHGRAVAKIIENLNVAPEHIEIAPYGLVGISVRYDFFVYCAVRDWLAANDYPHDIPHLDFEYHIYYDRRLPRFDDSEIDSDLDDEIDLDEELEYDSDDEDDWDFDDED
jgi:Rha family phage regulatory protein